jgi:hypothetical protein
MVGIFLIWGSKDPSGAFGLLLLIGAVLFLQFRAISNSARESYRLLSQRISRLEEQLQASQNKPTAEQVSAGDRGRDLGPS